MYFKSLLLTLLCSDDILTARTQSNGNRTPVNGDQTRGFSDQTRGFSDRTLIDKITEAIAPVVKEVQRLSKEVILGSNWPKTFINYWFRTSRLG